MLYILCEIQFALSYSKINLNYLPINLYQVMSIFIVIVLVIIVIIIGVLVASYVIAKNGGSRSQAPRIAKDGGAAQREIEARFLDVDVEAIIEKLKPIAHRKFAATLMTRTIFALPNGFARVRVTKGDPHDGTDGVRERVVLTSKIYPDRKAYDVADNAVSAAPIETELVLGENETYEDACGFMRSVGLPQKAEHEQYREEWTISPSKDIPAEGIIEIDWLPGLMPSMEIECPDEDSIRVIARALDLDYSRAVFGSYGRAYARVYGISEDVVNNQISELKFASVARVLAPFIRDNEDVMKRACSQSLPGTSHRT